MRQQGDLLRLLSEAYVIAPASAKEHIRRALETLRHEDPPLAQPWPPLTPAGGVDLRELREALQRRREDLKAARERSER